jgi:L-2-hydroxyglutarate oxidase LhgO
VDRIDCVVIGAGVVGLSVARQLALAGREVLVLEAMDGVGTGISSRNSEVIHAGIYYPAGSLKARLCVEGRQLLYKYCDERGIPHSRCGKLIVAVNPLQSSQLMTIIGNAAKNGVHDLSLLSSQEAKRLEPELECVAAIHSPSTGIVDSHTLMLSLQGDLENAGGAVVLNTAVRCVAFDGPQALLTTADGSQILANTVVNAAGLYAASLARSFGGLNERFVPQEHYAKGSYFSLSGRSPFSRLIYPVPEPGGLGVHLTIDMGGQAKFGPDVQWVQSPEDFLVDPSRGSAFYSAVRSYWPSLADGMLQPAYAGIRPKLSGPHSAPADFMIQHKDDHGIPGLVNLFGIESPGLTSSLAIAACVDELLRSQ